MKKIAIRLIILLLMVIAVGCGNGNENITKEDLQKNDWLIEIDDDDGEYAVMTATFSETNLTIGTDNSSLQSEEDDELEELGVAFDGVIWEEFEYTLNYTLEDNQLVMQDPEYETEMSHFFLERDGKNIIFTPTEEMNDEDGSFVLKPR
ncbi:MAG: hypothetical protein ACLSIL_13860 [Enterococcus casseliflavus]